MKKLLILVAILATGNYILVTSCNRTQTMPNPNAAPPQMVTTVAGPSFPLTSGGGASASFNQPFGVAADDTGNVYVADYDNNLIRKISASGVVSTLAGTGKQGSDNGAALSASFDLPSGVAVDKSGNVYVADLANNMIRKISPAGVVSTLAGTGDTGSINGPAATATFFQPTGVAVDNSGNVYVADLNNHMIRMISAAGVVSTVAGTGATGSANGPGSTATFMSPSSVAVDQSGNIYVADFTNQLIRKINSSGVVSTLAGSGSIGFVNGPDSAASFSAPFGVAVDASGNVYVAEAGNQDIRMISPSGVVSTLAGSGVVGSHNGIATQASFWFPTGVAVDGAGNVYVADRSNNLIREIDPSGLVSTLAGNGSVGSANSPATSSFSTPSGVAEDGQQNVYVADQNNNVIRKIDTKGVVTTFAGNGNRALVNGTALAASFDMPYAIAVDGSGNLYVSEADNVIRKITSSGMVSTLAGSGLTGSTNGVGTVASFNAPTGIAVDNRGNVYVADAGNNLIREISPSGVVSTLAGSGSPGYTDGDVQNQVAFNHPVGVAVDGQNNVYVADAGNNVIRIINPTGTTTMAGSGTPGSIDASGLKASFDDPSGIAVDGSGNVYVTDLGDNKIRYVSNQFGAVSTMAGTGAAGSANGPGSVATFNAPLGIAVDQHGHIYVADMGNNLIRVLTPLP